MSENRKALNMFISYSHKDEEYLNELKPHLATLKSNNDIKEWHDRKLLAGTKLDPEILKQLAKADIVVFLVSSDFLDSFYCTHVELKEALKRKNNRLIPIIIRPCSWEDSILSNYSAVPTDGEAISTYKNKDKGWLDVVTSIKEVVRSHLIQTTQHFDLSHSEKLIFTDEFKEYLDDTEIIFQHKHKDSVKTEDLFIYPDLQKMKEEYYKDDSYISSETLATIETDSNFILVLGDDQSGKTALSKMLIKQYFNSGLIPISCNGEDINSSKIDKKIKNCVNSQYNHSFDEIMQLNSSTVLLIDDFDKIKLNIKYQSTFLSNCADTFDKVVIFSNSSIKYDEQRFVKLSDFEHFEIRPLGHQKRYELISRWNSLGRTETIDLKELQLLNDNSKIHVNAIIRKNVLPPKPIYVLTILQLLDSSKITDYSLTSYGHCYQSIIQTALINVSIDEKEFDSFINYLTELAYYIYRTGNDRITVDSFSEFKRIYSQEYLLKSHNSVERKLLAAKILKNDGNMIYFNYKYIFYFYSAKYIADNLGGEQSKEQIEYLCASMHVEKNANILIFVVHHSKDTLVLEEILINTLLVFDEIQEATLNKEDTNFLAEFIQDIPEIVYEQKNPDDERKKVLKIQDEIESKDELRSEDEENGTRFNDKTFVEINKSLRAVEIIGQILRNRYGSLKKNQLSDLTAAAYGSGLKLLNFFLLLSKTEQDNIIKFIESMIEKKPNMDDDAISKMARDFYLMACYCASYGIIRRISNALGSDRLLPIFKDTCDNNPDSPILKLIYIAISLEFSKTIPKDEIKALYAELEGNIITRRLLKEVVLQYLYLNNVEHSDRNWITSTLKIPMKTVRLLQESKGGK